MQKQTEESFAKKPFPLLLDWRQFICSQINEVDPNDIVIADILNNNLEVGRIIVDFLIYQRIFVRRMVSLGKIVNVLPSSYSIVGESLKNQIISLESIHREFLDSFESVCKENVIDLPRLCIELLQNHIKIFELHENYIFSLQELEQLISALSSECAVFDEINLESLTVSQLFKIPVQWQTRISQFFGELSAYFLSISETSFNDILECYSRRSSTITSSMDSISILKQVSSTFLIEPFPIAIGGRCFIKQGVALKHCRKDISERHLLLFSDYFIYVQMKGGKYIVPGVYLLTQTRVEMFLWPNLYCLAIYAPKKSFVLEFKEEEDRDSWFSSLSTAIANAKAMSVDPIPSYEEAPIWTPDNATNVCMKCNQPLTFFIRRHHCRSCGCVACSNCVSHKIIVKNISNKKAVRVCNDCYEKQLTTDEK